MASPLTWRDIDRGKRRYADELIATEAESTALEALRTATGEVRGDMAQGRAVACRTTRRLLAGSVRDHTNALAADAPGMFRPPTPGRSAN